MTYRSTNMKFVSDIFKIPMIFILIVILAFKFYKKGIGELHWNSAYHV